MALCLASNPKIADSIQTHPPRKCTQSLLISPDSVAEKMRLQIDPEQQRLMMMLLSVGLFLHMTSSQTQNAAVEMKKILHL